MKRLFISLAALVLATGAALAQDAHFTGRIHNFGGGKVSIMSFENDDLNRDIDIAADGSFDVTLPSPQPSRAYLFFDDEHAATYFYIEPDMKADMQITMRDTIVNGDKVVRPSVIYTGDNKECYDYLQTHDAYSFLEVTEAWTWERLASTSFADYRELFRQDVDRARKEALTLSNDTFRRIILDEMEGQYSHCLFRFAWSKGVQDEVFLNWIESLDHNDPKDYDTASNYLRWYGDTHKGEYSNDMQGFFKKLADVFTSETLRNEFATEYTASYMESSEIEDKESLLALYDSFCTDADARARVHEAYEHFKNLRTGLPIVEFTMEDAKGKTISISDLKGKYLYIDCWATWCGPCCGEIPYMEKLYKHYKSNSAIKLISLSLDTNKQKWLKKIAADKPGWSQYILPDAFENPLCKTYGINGIPRFLMVDPDGNTISLDAPRPSSDDIIQWIESCMKK